MFDGDKPEGNKDDKSRVSVLLNRKNICPHTLISIKNDVGHSKELLFPCFNDSDIDLMLKICSKLQNYAFSNVALSKITDFLLN